MSKQLNIIKKISAATIGFDIKAVRKAAEKGGSQLYKVYGLVVGIAYGSGDNGPWTKFKGQFEAINLQTGEILRSGELFLPNQVTPILESQVIAAKGAEGFKGIQFALEIGCVESDTPIGYEYTSKDLMPAQENDLLVSMRNEHVDSKLLAKA